MIVDLDYTDNLPDLVRNLAEFERRQIPFATVYALNATAFEARAAAAAALDREMVLRNPQVARRLRVEKATRSRLVARVGHPDWFLQDQEEGDIRNPSRGYQGPPGGGGLVWIPSLAMRRGGVFAGKLTKRLRTLQRQMASAASKAASRSGVGKRRRRGKPKKPLPFIATGRSGKKGVYVRTTDRRKPLQLLYTLQEAVRIAPRWGFGPATQGAARRRYGPAFLEGLRRGVETSRTGPARTRYVEHLIGNGSGAQGGGVLSGLRANAPR